MNIFNWQGIAAAWVLGGVMIGGGVFQAQEWRYGAKISAMKATRQTELQAASDAAYKASEDYRKTEQAQRDAANAELKKMRDQLAASEPARRELAASNTGLRNALAAAAARSGAASVDSGARTGADDAGTLRVVVGECTSEYEALANAAYRAGLTLSGLQGWVTTLKPAK